jgi:hypothetical protein
MRCKTTILLVTSLGAAGACAVGSEEPASTHRLAPPAGPDAGAGDAHAGDDLASIADCDGVEDCDDGDPCNGLEACVDGWCASGAPVECDGGAVADAGADPVPAGDRTEGQACTGSDECVTGTRCVDVGGLARCMRDCTDDGDCVGPGSECAVSVGDARVCSGSCHPVAQTGCPTGSTCNVSREAPGSSSFMTLCMAPVGTGGQGAACTELSDCARGTVCVDTGAAGLRCLSWCDRATGDGCAGGTSCGGFVEPVRIDGREYGLCL